MISLLKKIFGQDHADTPAASHSIQVAEPSAECLSAVEQLVSEGYCLLPKVLGPADCEAITASFDAYVEASPDEAQAFVLSTKRHSRLCNLHVQSAAARAAISNPRVMAVLDRFFGAPAFVATSLYFEQSSEQAVHRDTPFFNTQPPDLYAGIWFALEDVHADSGPLRFFPGGHRLPVEVPKAETPDNIGRAWSAYCDKMIVDLRAQGYPEEFALLRQGDCFIWHPELPHGGSPINSPGKTRRSMVFHCASEKASMYGVEEFFGVQPFKPRPMSLVDMGYGRRMIGHRRPQFAANG